MPLQEAEGQRMSHIWNLRPLGKFERDQAIKVPLSKVLKALTAPVELLIGLKETQESCSSHCQLTDVNLCNCGDFNTNSAGEEYAESHHFTNT